MAMNRRDFLSGVAGACGASALGSFGGMNAKTLFPNEASSTNPLPPPDQSGINHIVVVTIENRSFDHFLGWLPGANGKQAGIAYPAPNPRLPCTYPLEPAFTDWTHSRPHRHYS